MITVRVNVAEHTDKVGREMERVTVAALNAAALRASLAADRAANTPKPIARFTVLPARRVVGGYASGLKAGPLIRIFDKGSLGQHQGRLKRARRPEWEVNRGANPYTAHRREPVAGSGVAPRSILSAARKAGREALIRRLRG